MNTVIIESPARHAAGGIGWNVQATQPASWTDKLDQFVFVEGLHGQNEFIRHGFAGIKMQQHWQG